ncbi:FliM/FliN family flagellar motor switch protein [Burkholderia plantarii]|uniref:FliM/FliN family flagellar motor switch protein n=1 Tax=Burkholderia plantarii TaxID=41899 RepID=UPI0006D8B74F|nr:FliM/FliN family flagellar motor C-terminal domain-containing protein [Burkholderia plantarii]ALK30153.1 surface presentation of antigens (SPOA) protein [Burkholderia plantarii]GLZ22011.1 hypothetical protein Bpla01_55400 [Burkholderia plantarii]
MSAPAVAWRPASDDDARLARALFDAALADWQARWFARPAFAIGAIVRRPGGEVPVVAPGRTGHRCAPGLRLDPRDALARRLIGAAYATDDGVFDAPASKGALASIAAEMLDDLVAALGTALTPAAAAPRDGDAPSFSGYGTLDLAIESMDGEPCASLVCDIRHVWARHAAASSTSPASSTAAALTPRREALDATPVALSVVLGRCELSAAQLTMLSPGDVIVLDRRLDEPATLVVDATAAPVALGLPGRGATSLSFKLTSLATPDSP